jgi:hypothetical protein
MLNKMSNIVFDIKFLQNMLKVKLERQKQSKCQTNKIKTN